MMRTSETDMANSIEPADIDIDTFIDNAAKVNCKTYHKILQASPGAATLEQDTIFDVTLIAHW